MKKKSAQIALTAAGFIFGMAASYADVLISSGGKPKAGDYNAIIKSVQIGYSEDMSSSGQVITRKHGHVYVSTLGEGNLEFIFNQHDMQSGLALIGAIGKKINVELDLDEKSALIVKNIIVK
jgi:hypothetical protein